MAIAAADTFAADAVAAAASSVSRKSPAEACSPMSGKLRWVLRHAAELYAAARKDAAVDTHRNALGAARRFVGWCIERGWLRENPFAKVKGLGRRRRGKPQLRIDEATRLVDACIDEWSAESAAVLCAFVLAMRADEVASRRVRDLDDGGRLLWIPDAKTPAGRRTLEVPEVLRPLLLELARGKEPAEGLFGERTRYWTYYHVQRLCKKAGVPVVPPHGLRGTHSTIADEAGITGHVIAAAMGHRTAAVTRSNYIDVGRSRAAQSRRAIGRLGSGKFSGRSTFQEADAETTTLDESEIRER